MTVTMFFTYCWQLSNSMEQYASEGNSSSVIQKICCILWILKIYHHPHNGLSLLSYIKLLQSTPFHSVSIRCILILPYHLGLGLWSGYFPSCFNNKLICAFLFPMHSTCPTHLILFEFITQVLFGGALHTMKLLIM
jgi:hypothetical protein